MGEELFYGPTVAVIATFFALNALYCCLGVRRIIQVERRVHALENVQISNQAARTEAVQPTTTTSYVAPATYIRPATYANPVATSYAYYQPQPQATAPTYYSQDPQMLYK